MVLRAKDLQYLHQNSKSAMMQEKNPRLYKLSFVVPYMTFISSRGDGADVRSGAGTP